MQTSGGYRYPSNSITTVFTVVVVGVTLGLSFELGLSSIGTWILFAQLQGIVLAAAAFTPVGLTPPPRGFARKVLWFLKTQRGVSVQFNQPLFYLGMLLLLSGVILGSIAEKTDVTTCSATSISQEEKS